MEGLLAEVRDRYGSWDGYATEIGVDASTLTTLTTSLLE
jgi:hypothetical protein